MHDAIRSTCAFLLLSASFAFSQSTTTSNGQNAGAATTPGATTNSGVANEASGMSNTAASGSMDTMSGNPAVEANIAKIEQELGQAYKAHDAAPFTKYLDDNVVVIFSGHKEQGKATVIQGITTNPCVVNSTVSSDFTYKWISPDAVLVTYADKVDETCGGKPSSPMDYNTSVWRRKGGDWVNIFHQSTTGVPTVPAETAVSPSGML